MAQHVTSEVSSDACRPIEAMNIISRICIVTKKPRSQTNTVVLHVFAVYHFVVISVVGFLWIPEQPLVTVNLDLSCSAGVFTIQN